MDIIRIHAHGGPEVLQLESAPVPSPGPGEILVRVRAAAVNWSDTMRRRDDAYPFPSPLPFTPGGEVAGVVEALGTGVDGPPVGTPVFGLAGPDGSTGHGDGSLVPWPDQDRSRWDVAMIDEARSLLAATVPAAGSRSGPYALQAAIALLHAVAEPGAEPDWMLIGELYQALERQLPSAAVTVNRAAALARAGRPDDALGLLAPLTGDTRHADYVALHAVRADALLRAGQQVAAAEASDTAAAHARTPAVRGHLTGRRDDVRLGRAAGRGPDPESDAGSPRAQARRPDQVQA